MNWRWPQIQNPIVWLTRLAALIMSLDIVSLFIRADNFTASAVCCRLMSSKIRGIWGIRLPRRGYRIQPRVSTLGNFNLAVRPEAHKEHGRITCDGGSGNVAWVWLQRSVSCGNWGKLIAHLASVGL